MFAHRLVRYYVRTLPAVAGTFFRAHRVRVHLREVIRRVGRLCMSLSNLKIASHARDRAFTRSFAPFVSQGYDLCVFVTQVIAARFVCVVTCNKLRFHVVRVCRVETPLYVTFLDRRQDMEARNRRVAIAFRSASVRDLTRDHFRVIQASQDVNYVLSRVGL